MCSFRESNLADTATAGSRLRSIRNENRMKASHVARLAGHEALADIISSARAPRPQRGSRRRRGQRDALRTHAGGIPRQSGNPTVVLQLLKEVCSLCTPCQGFLLTRKAKLTGELFACRIIIIFCQKGPVSLLHAYTVKIR